MKGPVIERTGHPAVGFFGAVGSSKKRAANQIVSKALPVGNITDPVISQRLQTRVVDGECHFRVRGEGEQQESN